jgi:glutamate synthase (NADPH/NADH) large chain
MTGGRVVVLGATGSNFAAGMSGGIAYVFNEKGNFDFYCNMGMVECIMVEDLNDIDELKNLIPRTLYLTPEVKKAGMILDYFNNFLPMFIKVNPYDYKKVIQEQKLEELRKKIATVEIDVDIDPN